ncbi:G-protein coupled receptor GRL101-like [Patella vulgata]|uniref:G-protein coupled receptor GRL101-like n=1 Tax=Patella vulgata TaxID=6465 RepID=UPI0024A7B1DC|nr:G-protein coupled receptor GRL101-like [Patella vulgata]
MTKVQYVNLLSLDLSYNNITILYRGTFRGLHRLQNLELLVQGLSNLITVHSDSFIFCCLKPDSVTDDNCYPKRGTFSSCDNLMRREVLRIFMWVIGVCALTGNFGTVLYRLILDRGMLKSGSGLYITHLGISDFLMGIYMLAIGVVDAMFRGKYIYFDQWWRNSTYCQVLGALATLSSEASALFLCLITLDRFLLIRYPLGQVRISPRMCRTAIICVWLFSLVIALVPVLPGICLALPLTPDRTPGWQYSTAVFVFFNFMTFLLICIGQAIMYKSVVQSGSCVQSKERQARDLQIARTLSIIVITDFICWFPICCMGLMSLGGVSIDSEVYAWAAVFILPVNSALNPIIYTASAYYKHYNLLSLDLSFNNITILYRGTFRGLNRLQNLKLQGNELLREIEPGTNSTYCQVLGALATLSREASALFLCLITLDRFLIIKYPLVQARLSPRMRLVSLGGVSIDSEVYAWAAVFILPVNSTLNPVIYTASAYYKHYV